MSRFVKSLVTRNETDFGPEDLTIVRAVSFARGLVFGVWLCCYVIVPVVPAENPLKRLMMRSKINNLKRTV